MDKEKILKMYNLTEKLYKENQELKKQLQNKDSKKEGDTSLESKIDKMLSLHESTVKELDKKDIQLEKLTKENNVDSFKNEIEQLLKGDK